MCSHQAETKPTESLDLVLAYVCSLKISFVFVSHFAQDKNSFQVFLFSPMSGHVFMLQLLKLIYVFLFSEHHISAVTAF